jgi:DNA-directed RNA polymerase subunit RPC12/RpoP
MVSIPNGHFKTCPQCGSRLVSLEWDEHVNPGEIQDLWHCWKCQSEFVTVEASDEKEPSVAEITKPFFTSLVME